MDLANPRVKNPVASTTPSAETASTPPLAGGESRLPILTNLVDDIAEFIKTFLTYDPFGS